MHIKNEQPGLPPLLPVLRRSEDSGMQRGVVVPAKIAFEPNCVEMHVRATHRCEICSLTEINTFRMWLPYFDPIDLGLSAWLVWPYTLHTARFPARTRMKSLNPPPTGASEIVWSM